MALSKEDIQLLAQLIVEEISNNFKDKYITHNLVDTISVVENDQGGLDIKIPAQLYDLKVWRKSKTIVHKPGSYANLVNEEGGFSGTHKNYVENAIEKALGRWQQTLANKGITMVK